MSSYLDGYKKELNRDIEKVRLQLKELRKEMSALGIKKTSPFNGGMDMETYRYNASRFELETRLKDEQKR